MKTLFALLSLTMLSTVPALAIPRTYELPEETATLAQGPDAVASCGACHSAEYVTTQPRGLANPRAFWQAEVVKMRGAYGAPIEDADIPAIVDYLVATYGK